MPNLPKEHNGRLRIKKQSVWALWYLIAFQFQSGVFLCRSSSPKVLNHHVYSQKGQSDQMVRKKHTRHCPGGLDNELILYRSNSISEWHHSQTRREIVFHLLKIANL